MRLAAMLQKLEARCAEAYRVVGSLATDAGLFHDLAVIRALYLLIQPLRKGDIFPVYTAKDLTRTAVQSPPRAKTKSSPKSGPAKGRKSSGKCQQRTILAQARSGMQLRGGPVGRNFAEDRHELADREFFFGPPQRREDWRIVL
jgi:hypothetical protein